MAAADGKMATATAAVTAHTTAATAMARRSAGRHRRHAEHRGRRDRNDCLRIEVSPFLGPRPFLRANSSNRRSVACRAFLTKKKDRYDSRGEWLSEHFCTERRVRRLGRVKSSAALTAAAYMGRAARVRTMNAQPSRTNLLGAERHQRRWLALVYAE